ncbi:MAG: hypothetical protein NT162_00045, partial [Candidatus Woesebacteria bacterium]|nr:hypothetical protein [Candidatus Woesebacteria bacterium]
MQNKEKIKYSIKVKKVTMNKLGKIILMTFLIGTIFLNSGVAINLGYCTDISTAGVYTMNQSILNSADADSCILIGGPNVWLDCAGFTIEGRKTASTYGIRVNSSANLNSSVFNCTVRGWARGIYLQSASNNNLS